VSHSVSYASPSLPTALLSPPLPSFSILLALLLSLFSILCCALVHSVSLSSCLLFSVMLSNTHPRPTQLPVRRDLSPTSFATTRFTALATADLQSFSSSTIKIVCPIHFCDFRSPSVDIIPKPTAHSKPPPTFPSWMTRDCPDI
jgi:hypothetical protein